MTENISNESTNSESIDTTINETDVKPIEEQPNRSPVVPINREVIREDMVKTAVNFLLNPRVIDSPLTQKRTFLLKKGLSLEEIDLAIDRSSNRLTRSQSHSLQQINPNNYSPQQMVEPIVQPMPSFLSRSTYFVSNVALFGGFLYGVYVFYKRFIEALIFEKNPKPHPFVTIQLQLDQLSKVMDVLKDNMSSIEINIRKQIEDEISVIRAPQDSTIHELKSELASIKALLVNRRQFTSTPVGAIPVWQMNDNKESNNKTDYQNPNESEKAVNGFDNKSENDTDFGGIGAHNMSNGSNEVNGVQTCELQD